MNTPNDASDTAITRLIENESGTVALEELPEVSDEIQDAVDAATAKCVGQQMADIERYLAIVGIAFDAQQSKYIRECLSCAFLEGVAYGASDAS